MAWVKHHDKYTGHDCCGRQARYEAAAKMHDCLRKKSTPDKGRARYIVPSSLDSLRVMASHHSATFAVSTPL